RAPPRSTLPPYTTLFRSSSGRLAQHVVRIAKALVLHRSAVGDRSRYGLAGHELLAHHAHGHIDALAYQRLAALAYQAGQRLGQRSEEHTSELQSRENLVC